MRKFLFTLLDIGTRMEAAPSTNRLVRVSNAYLLVFCAVCVIYGLFFYSLGLDNYASLTLLFLATFISAFLATHYGWHYLARVITHLMLTAAIYTYSAGFGLQAGVFFWFNVPVMYPFSVFDVKDERNSMAWASVPVVALCFAWLTGFRHSPLPPAVFDASWNWWISCAMLVGAVPVALSMIYRLATDYHLAYDMLIEELRVSTRSRLEIENKTLLIESIVENIPVALFLKDARNDFRISLWNKAAENIFGVPRAEAIGKTLTELGLKDTTASELISPEHVAEYYSTVDIPEQPAYARGRGRIWLHTQKVPLRLGNQSETSFVIGICEDITEAKYKESAARNTLRQLQTLADNLPGFVSRCDLEGRFTFANKMYEEWYGWQHTELIGRTQIEVLPPAAWEQAKEPIQRALRGERVGYEARMLTHKGKELDVYVMHIPDYDETGVLTGYFNVVLDISDLKISQRLLEQEKMRFENVVKGLNQSSIVAITDSRGSILEVNGMFLKVSGYSEEELIGANHRILNSGFHPTEFFTNMWRTLRQGNVWKGEICNRRKDGTLYWVDTTITPVRTATGETRFLSIRHEITDRKEAEAKLIHSSKLASLGEMAAGIAHEINNPLAIIKGAVGLLPRFANDPEKLAHKVDAIQRSCERISRIVLGLRKFSRSGARKTYSPHSLCDIIREVLVLTEAKSTRHNTPVSLDCQGHPWINCDEVEIEQVLVNLINNAIDAVKDREERWVRLELLQEDEMAIVRVHDSGPGIPEAVRNKLFHPFFTTKDVGQGTGLGLSISKGIIDEHGAKIALLTQLKNTCFEIRFPCVEAIKNAA